MHFDGPWLMSETPLVLVLATWREFAQQNESHVFCFTPSCSLARLLSVCLSAVPQNLCSIFIWLFFEGGTGATVWHSDAKVKWQATKREREREWEREKEKIPLNCCKFVVLQYYVELLATKRILRTWWKLLVIYNLTIYTYTYIRVKSNLYITCGCFNWF